MDGAQGEGRALPLSVQRSPWRVPDTRGDLSTLTPSMWLLAPTALLLLASASTRADLRKAVVALDPQWDRVLEQDSVALRCQGADPREDNSTRWFRNGDQLPAQTSSYVLAAARVADSGQYRCQTSRSALSDPVRLEVHAAWLLLQAPRWTLPAGEALRLRCHTWRNKPVHKVQYFRNGQGQQFSYRNKEFHVPQAGLRHSGSYFCRGMIGALNVSSQPVNVTVEGPEDLDVSLPWHLVVLFLVTALLFAVDTGLYFSVRRELQRSLTSRRLRSATWSKRP